MKQLIIFLLAAALCVASFAAGEELTVMDGKTYYVSAEHGSDDASGERHAPLRTISEAASRMKPFDACVISEGVYRESVCVLSDNARFQAVPGDKVVVSGLKPVSGDWERISENIFRAPCARKTAIAFRDGRALVEARWPNVSYRDLMSEEKRAIAADGTDGAKICDPKLPDVNLTTARVHITVGAGWVSFTRKISEIKPGEFVKLDTPFAASFSELDQIDPFSPIPGNKYSIFGDIALLDTEDEFFWDGEYIYLCSESAPQNVEVGDGDSVGFRLDDRKDVTVEGITLLACQLSMERCENCVADSLAVLYSQYFSAADGYDSMAIKNNLTTGSGNTWRNCEVAFASGDGISLGGERNSIENCVIHDVNTNANYFACVNIESGSRANAVRYSTLYRCGRFAIFHSHASELSILNNHIYNYGLLTKDYGATYTYGTDGRGSEIAYNLIENTAKPHAVGVYLDNFSSNYKVHHNIVSRVVFGAGIRLNSDSLDNWVFNNTVSGCELTFAVYAHSGHTLTQKGTKVFNNIASGPMMFAVGENAPFTEANLKARVDSEFRPARDSVCVDGGIIIEGINDEYAYMGEAPDIGALEYGIPAFRIGADWKASY